MNYLPLVILLVVYQVRADMNDDPLLLGGNFPRIEYQEGGGSTFEGELWVGRDLSRWVFEIEQEWEEGETADRTYNLFHRRGVSAYWNLELGVRQLDNPGSDASAVMIGFSGTAPYFVETEAALYLRHGQASFELDLHHELPLSSSWVFVSSLEATANLESDAKRDQGSGFSGLEAQVRVQFEGYKNAHPYIGYQSTHFFGDTAGLRSAQGEDNHSNALVIGLRAWF